MTDYCEHSLTIGMPNLTKEQIRMIEKKLKHLIAQYERQYGEPLRLIEHRWDRQPNSLVIYAHTGIADTDQEHLLIVKYQQ